MHHPPPPNPHDLLPPLLSCLPASFISPRPPPALLPLLFPLLRQRLTYLPSSDPWLPLLSWNPRCAVRLPEVIEQMDLEPHPASGEIEIGDVPPAKWRRLDEETLLAALEVSECGLKGVYVWCEGEGEEEGWRLHELRPLDDDDGGGEEWFDTISAATDAAAPTRDVPRSNGTSAQGPTVGSTHADEEGGDDDDDDDYWASYDRTPGRTPAQKCSPAPPSSTLRNGGGTRPARPQSELEYFARYGNEVQPVMDGHDPSEEEVSPPPPPAETTLTNGSALSGATPYVGLANLHPPAPMYPSSSAHGEAEKEQSLSMPRPLSPSSTSSHDSVDKLEEQAAAMSAAQRGIRQHISTDVKSLYRLARSAGMEREEFERVVRTELELLGLMEDGV